MPSRLSVLLVSLLLAAPAVVFWLWLVIVPAKVAMLCPEECRCDTGGYQVKCNGRSITSIPFRLTDVRNLELTMCNINLFENESFVSLNELETLNVLLCGLRTIELGAFNGLTKLTHLYIRSNEISEIMPGTFVKMSSLEYLQLDHNRLENLDSDLFSGLVNLKYIHLEYNRLQYLHPDTFLGLPKLQRLYLYNNPGLQIPTDRHFINSHPLSQLYISGCNINSVSVETFANVSALELLDLSINNLRTVDINILKVLPKLSEILLHDNPLLCDCQLQEVWRWCKDRNIRTAYLGIAPKCDKPIEVEGIWWGVLGEGQCLEGNIEYSGDYRNISYSFSDIEDSYLYEFNSDFLKLYQVPIYAFPFIFGTTGNVILLIIIICNKDMRTVPNMYILNLVISDIIYLTVLFSEAYANKISDTWLDGDFLCTFLPFYRRLSVGLSAYSVAVLSIQRYRVIVQPLQFRVSSPPTWRGIVARFCGLWIVAALFAIPSALSKYLCQDYNFLIITTYYQLVVIFELLVSCVLPLCVIAFSYIMTARRLMESSCPISDGTENPQLKIRRSTAKIVVGLTVVFVFSYVPYHVFWTYFICTIEKSSIEKNIFSRKNTDFFRYSNYKFQYTYLISTCFLLINSCLNPVALFCTSSPFRQHLKRYLTCFCKIDSLPTEFELSRRN